MNFKKYNRNVLDYEAGQLGTRRKCKTCACFCRDCACEFRECRACRCFLVRTPVYGKDMRFKRVVEKVRVGVPVFPLGAGACARCLNAPVFTDLKAHYVKMHYSAFILGKL